MNHNNLFSKKYIAVLIIFVMVISGICLFYNISSYTIDTPYDYPNGEKNIPVEIIEKMTTEALLKSYIYNEATVPNYGSRFPVQFQLKKENSSALAALTERDDLIEAIYNIYKPLEVYPGDMTELSFDEQSKIYAEMDILTHIEFICAQIDLDNSPKEHAVKLKNLLEEKHQQKLTTENGQTVIKFPPGYHLLKGGRQSSDWIYIP
ncbi:MAG: hypothetical protein IJO47_03985 [Clostridia bacterium]|nr:hypothetical protein [Clostridia bacterium]